ncbi:MAG: DUF4056 domain-containing protein, partial [Hafnia sp.]
MNVVKYGLITGILLSSSCFSQIKLPIVPDLSTSPLQQATRAWPTVEMLSAPDGLRPCCAFGYNLKAQALGIPVPLYQLNNVVEAD